MRWLAVIGLATAVLMTSCDDDVAGAPDLSRGDYCYPDVRTCEGKDVCGAPCDTSCTDHGCFESYDCQCVGGHLDCRSPTGGRCDMAVSAFDLTLSD